MKKYTLVVKKNIPFKSAPDDKILFEVRSSEILHSTSSMSLSKIKE